mmetsp:Transcript_149754/g.279206  ORF Transcript_149754/g.279206 Transcript_149754/m.279206 type:complete len:103 (+) Transcript_149754:105-413(+)
MNGQFVRTPQRRFVRLTSPLRALTAAAVFRTLNPDCAPMADFVRSWNKFGEPGLEEHDGGGRLRRSCSRCVFPRWKRHDGRMTTLLSAPAAPCVWDIASDIL